MNQTRCIIIAAGDFCPEDLDALEGGIRQNDFVIACDAGLLHCDEAGVVPDLLVGDFDSAKRFGSELLERIDRMEANEKDRVLRLPVVKDDTDLMAAIKEGLRLGYRDFYLFGALGGKRFSLSFAAVQSLLYIKHHGAQGVILSQGTSVRILEDEERVYPAGKRGSVSLFSLTERVSGLTIQGLQYELQDAVLAGDFPLGVSNAFLPDKEARILVKEGALLVVEEEALI